MRMNWIGNRRPRRKTSIVLSVIMGVILLVVTSMMVVKSVQQDALKREIRENGAAVQAVCTYTWTETKTTRTKSGTKNHKTTKTRTHTYYYANGKYTYDGQTYTCNKLSVSQNTQVGDEMTIYILRDDPSKWVQNTSESSIGWIILLGYLPVILVLVFVIPLSVRRRRRNRENFSDFNGYDGYNYNL